MHAAQRQQMADIAADPTRPRWARVPRGRVTCAFCAMLAGRGFVYTSEEAAGGLGNVYHAHCDCEPVPTWGEAKLTGYDQPRYEGMYRSACKALGDGASSQSICGWIRDHFPVSDATVTEMHSRGVSSVDGCVNWEQRANYMRETWDVIMDKGIAGLPEECQKAIVGGIDDAFAFRPAMKGAVSRVKLAHPGDEGFNERAYADTSYWNGVMRCSDVWFADSKALAAQYAYDLSRGFHVRNTTPRSITAHETAHAIEYIAYLKATNQKNDAAAVQAFSGLAESNVIVNPTARRILAKHNRGVEDLATEISGYARYQGQLHETIAEAYVDAIYNGKQASALSLDIVDAFIDNRGGVR